MQLPTIILISIYALLMIAYIITKALKVGKKRRGIIKMSLVAVFLAIAIYGVVINQSFATTWLCLFGLVFAGIGDFFLIFSDQRQKFHMGVVAFGISNILLIVYSVVRFGFSWWTLVPYLFFVTINIVAQRLNIYTYGSSKSYLNIYFPIVSLSGCIGLLLAFFATSVSAMLLAIGTLSFFISDVFLGLYFYKVKHWVIDGINSLFYFGGIAMIALSLVL